MTTTTATTYTIGREHTALAIAASINHDLEQGHRVTVNGRVAKPRFRTLVAAGCWTNGSLSVDVEGRTPGAVGTVWAKVGQTITVEVAR